MIQTAVKAVSKIQFNEALAHRFLGCWLTEPNQAAVFDSYEDHGDEEDEDEPYTHWILDRRTRMLYRGKQLFINGEVAAVEAEAGLKILADARELAGTNPAAKKISQDAVEALADWLDAGWIHLVRKAS